jgi:hypothetical protein
MNEVPRRSSGALVHFPDAASRPQRAIPSPDEPRGEILLFTGVRYERNVAHSGPSRPFASDGPGHRRSS